MKTCSKRGCSEKHKAKGLCEYHYNNARTRGLIPSQKPCSVTQCTGKAIEKGLCSAHVQRLRLNGNVNAEKPIGSKDGHWNPKWRGGEVKMDGRTLIYSPNHPYPNLCGIYVFRYRLVMEKHLGRYLTTDEVIHHKNGDVSDDRIANLEVITQSQHARQHRNPKTRRFQSIATNLGTTSQL